MIKDVNYESNTTFKGSETKTEAKQEKTPEQIKNGKKKLAIGLAAAATVAVAGIAIAAKVKNGKAASINLSDIKFDKGIASLNGEKFTGTVSDTLANGDKISLTYEDGKIAQSIREGSKNITKKFNYMPDAIKPSTVETLDPKGEIINKATFEYCDDGKTKLFIDKNRAFELDTYSGYKAVYATTEECNADGSISYKADMENWKAYSKDNKLEKEQLPDGTFREYHDGQLVKEECPNGLTKEYRNGRLFHTRGRGINY